MGPIVVAQESADSSQTVQKVHTLEPDRTEERELAGGEAHSYQVTLASGQHLYVMVDQCGINIVAELFGPGGKQLAEVNNSNGKYGHEAILVAASTSGIYRLEVCSREKEASPGRYFLKIEKLEVASSRDSTHIAAERAWAEGVQLFENRTAESRRKMIEKYEQALPLWQAVGDHRQETKILHRIGYVYKLLGEKQKALDYFDQALRLRQAERDSVGEANELNDIGSLYNSWGKYQKAFEYYSQALSLAQAARAHTHASTALLNLGAAFGNLGDFQKAAEYYHQVLPLFQNSKDRHGEATTLHNLGDVYKYWGEHQKALAYFDRALQLKQCVGDRRGEANVLQSIGTIHQALNENQQALDCYNQALPLARLVGNRVGEANALQCIGSVYKNLREHQKALDYFGQALSIWRSLRSPRDEAITLYEIARVELDRGHLAKARPDIESALTLIESLRTEVVNLELRAAYFASARKCYAFYIELLMRLEQLHPSEGYAAAALQASERARARILLETLAEARTDVRQGVDPVLVERERALQQQLNAAADRLTRLLSVEHTQEDSTAAKKGLEALLAEYQEIQARIRATSPHYAALTQPQPLSAQEIQQQVLDDETLLLEYALGEARSFLWAVTPTTINSFELPRQAEIDSLARRVYDLLTAHNKRIAGETPQGKQARLARSEAEYPKAARVLSQMLLGPIAEKLGTKRLLVVAEGALLYIPFGALPVPVISDQSPVISDQSPVISNQSSVISNQSPVISEERVLNTDHWSLITDYRPLITRHEIISLPSASALAVLRRELAGRKPAEKMIAVLADPVFNSHDSRVMNTASALVDVSAAPLADNTALNLRELEFERATREIRAAGEGVAFKRLHLSREEARAIVKYAGREKSRLALDFEAARRLAKSAEMSQYRIVHFATHGLLNSAHPELSGIVLSLVDSAGVPQDGFLRLHEIYNLNLPADLVVLSACQTALGKEIFGEGLLGLTRGFMYAGAARVVASLWKVDDMATAELMKRFYQALLQGEKLRPAAALRAAQVSMWKEKRWQSSYYWAAFVLQGEWR